MRRQLGLYVHFPWCVRKCPYCDFNSHPLRAPLAEEDYIDALLVDLRQEALNLNSDHVISTVFFGGGTPSLFSAAGFTRLLTEIRRTVQVDADAEITMEANPGTVELGASLIDYRTAGINRISFGVQSFDTEQLQRLGRIHSAEEARAAFGAARRAGFEQINLDLMHGLPEQTLAAAMDDLDAAIALDPSHVSWYRLTLEPHTEFFRRPPPLPDDNAIADIADAGVERLAQAGFRRYEVSAYAQSGADCRHNTNYWTFGDYLGIGAGAHGKLTRGNRVERVEKPRQPRLYLRADPPTRSLVGTDELPVEFMMNVLRLTEGVAETEFLARTGLPWSEIATPVAKLRGLGVMRHDRIALTSTGYDHLDSAVAAFL